MNLKAFKQELEEQLKRTKSVNAHSHHYSTEQYRGMDLLGVLKGSYCQWMDPADHFERDPEGYLRKNECNSYFRWLSAALRKNLFLCLLRSRDRILYSCLESIHSGRRV